MRHAPFSPCRSMSRLKLSRVKLQAFIRPFVVRVAIFIDSISVRLLTASPYVRCAGQGSTVYYCFLRSTLKALSEFKCVLTSIVMIVERYSEVSNGGCQERRSKSLKCWEHLHFVLQEEFM